MNNNCNLIKEYLQSIYLPYYFLKIDTSKGIYINTEKSEVPAIENFSSEDIRNFIQNNKSAIERMTAFQLIEEIIKPIYFSVDELRIIQMSNDPFTVEEIENILDDELNRNNYEDINCDVVEFCLDYLSANEKHNRVSQSIS